MLIYSRATGCTRTIFSFGKYLNNYKKISKLMLISQINDSACLLPKLEATWQSSARIAIEAPPVRNKGAIIIIEKLML